MGLYYVLGWRHFGRYFWKHSGYGSPLLKEYSGGLGEITITGLSVVLVFVFVCVFMYVFVFVFLFVFVFVFVFVFS